MSRNRKRHLLRLWLTNNSFKDGGPAPRQYGLRKRDDALVPGYPTKIGGYRAASADSESILVGQGPAAFTSFRPEAWPAQPAFLPASRRSCIRS